MNKYTGGDFDDFLEEEGILDEVSARAQKRVIALQIAAIMKEENITKTKLSQRIKTSRSQLDRILDTENTAVTIETLGRVAHALGRTLRIEIA